MIPCATRVKATLAGIVLILLGLGIESGRGAALPRPNLIPLPRQMEAVPGPWSLAGARIVCAQMVEPIVAAGVEEVQKTLRGMELPALPVDATDGAGLARAADNVSILVGVAKPSNEVGRMAAELGVQINSTNPGPQGYVIRFEKRNGSRVVLLAGSDSVGALYACVTFAQMLRRQGDLAWIDPAHVRDWPDFHHRLIGRPPGPSARLRAAQSIAAPDREYREFVDAMCEAVDFCVRFKINGLTLRSGGTEKLSHVQSYGPAARAAWKEISAYAGQRGVFLEASAYSAIDVGQGGAAAELKDIVRTHGVGYCWSRDDLLRQQAREFGRFARDAGIGLYYLHAPDRTTLDNPGLFKNRCTLCRQRWKDDQRAQADAHVLNIMYEEIKRLSPSTRLCAVLVPYGATLDRLDGSLRREVVKYWTEASALLPEDMAICVREDRRPNVAAFKDAFARHPIYFYIESISWRGWEPAFSTTPRMLRTFDFDDPRDTYYMGNCGDFRRINEALAAHFAWNTRAPGAGWQRAYNHDPIHDGTEPREVAGPLLDAVAGRMFGEDFGPRIAEAVRGDISWPFTLEPEAMSRAARERLAGVGTDIPGTARTEIAELANIPALMRHQLVGSERGVRLLGGIVEEARRGGRKLNSWQTHELGTLLSYFGSVHALASVRAPRLECEKALQEGRRERAGELAGVALAALSSAPAELKRIEQLIGGMESWHAPARRVAAHLAAEQPRLRLLDQLARGIVIEAADTDENLRSAVFLLRRGKVAPRSSGNGSLELSGQRARTPGQPALLFTPPARAWNGCGVSFAPADVRPYLAANGYLRFYVNSAGPKGFQRATIIAGFESANDSSGKPVRSSRFVYLHPPSREEQQRNKRPGYVDVDDLPETWQVVSVPLSELVPEGGAFLSSLQLNFAQVPDCGLLIADPYLIGNTELVERKTTLP